MEMQITGKNVELLPTVRRYVVRKLDKINRLLPKIVAFDVEIAEEQTRSPQQRFIVQVTINSNGTLLRGEERGQDVFTAIDKVAGVMNRQVEHFKGKLYDKGRGNSTIRGTVAEQTGAVGEMVTTEPTAEDKPKVVKTKRFDIKPMSMDEAMDQMELLGHDFFLFLNADTGELNLLYRRRDGNYGVIETALRT